MMGEKNKQKHYGAVRELSYYNIPRSDYCIERRKHKRKDGRNIRITLSLTPLSSKMEPMNYSYLGEMYSKHQCIEQFEILFTEKEWVQFLDNLNLSEADKGKAKVIK